MWVGLAVRREQRAKTEGMLMSIRGTLSLSRWAETHVTAAAPPSHNIAGDDFSGGGDLSVCFVGENYSVWKSESIVSSSGRRRSESVSTRYVRAFQVKINALLFKRRR